MLKGGLYGEDRRGELIEEIKKNNSDFEYAPTYYKRNENFIKENW